MKTYLGTCWRTDLSPWFKDKPFDSFVLMIEEPDWTMGLVRCLILGFDSDDWEAKPGHTVEVKVKDLRPMFQ